MDAHRVSIKHPSSIGEQSLNCASLMDNERVFKEY